MSYDGIVLRAVALELDRLLKGARIDKIFQPNRNEVLINMRQPGHNYRLMLSSSAQEPGVYLTTRPSSNPMTPPLFCMLLRKHLEGGRILGFSQFSLERIIEMTCEVIDDFGDTVLRKLIIEIMGKHSNIILVDPSNNKIIDAVYRVTPAVSRYRQVLPGLFYEAPPPQHKLIPSETSQESFVEKLFSYSLSQTISKIILSSFLGFGPQTVEEIIYRSGLSPNLTLEYCGEYEMNKLWRSFKQISETILHGNFSPEIVYDHEIPLAFSSIALTQYAEHTRQPYASMSEAVDIFYSHKSKTNQFLQKKNDLMQIIKKEIDRNEKKAGLQLATINEAADSEHFRLWGELLTAQLHSLKPGKKAEVINFYSPEADYVIIPLEENLSILENAQRYFQKYRKAKNSAQKTLPLYEETQTELAYLSSITAALENVSTLAEIEEIRDELKDAGYIKITLAKNSKSKTPASTPTAPLRLLLDGFDVYVGKNNKQNDQLVTKIARPDDLWLHTKDIPGSHVVIKNKGTLAIPDEILEKAALLAAYYSKARNSTNVPVDYTLRKHVWKLKGAKPGMVHYENQRTVFVTPDKDLINSLL